jgi:hypothetical protein
MEGFSEAASKSTGCPASPETGFHESACFLQGASVIVVELLDGFGGEVVEKLVGRSVLNQRTAFGSADLDVTTMAQRCLLVVPSSSIVCVRDVKRLAFGRSKRNDA